MATIGQQLTAPETGWKRINHSNNNIQYFGSDWLFNESSHYLPSGLNPEQLKLNTVKLVFYGTKFRLIGSRYLNYSSDLKIIIDNVEENVSVYSPTIQENILNYEKIGLSLGNHTVEIISNDGLRYNVVSVDVDDTGYMLHPILSRKTSLAEMQIGDYIPCRYQASSEAVGAFSELGTCNMAEIPLNGSATPNGLFNFIKVDKGLLIADRVVQHSISWDTMNAGGIIEGKIITLNGVSILIRSMTCGVAYADNEEKTEFSLIDKGFGAFPLNNEWDKYIVNSDLEGKITAGDTSVWNYNYGLEWSKNIPIIGFKNPENSSVASNTSRIIPVMGNVAYPSQRSWVISTTLATWLGFRPVLQYIEPYISTKQKTLWY